MTPLLVLVGYIFIAGIVHLLLDTPYIEDRMELDEDEAIMFSVMWILIVPSIIFYGLTYSIFNLPKWITIGIVKLVTRKETA